MKILNNSVQNFKFKSRFAFKRFLPEISIIVPLIYIFLTIGCYYYKVNTLDPLSNESIAEQVQKKGKYIIIHQGNDVWHLTDVVVNEPGQEIKGTVQTLSLNHRYYATAKSDHVPKHYVPKGKSADNPIHEIHIYTFVDTYSSDSILSIPFSSISKVEVYDTDIGSTVFVTLGALAVVAGIMALIVIATKSSCPFVYTNNGVSYNFAGEMYRGNLCFT